MTIVLSLLSSGFFVSSTRLLATGTLPVLYHRSFLCEPMICHLTLEQVSIATIDFSWTVSRRSGSVGALVALVSALDRTVWMS